MTEAKIIASAQSFMSESQKFLHKVSRYSGAKKHAQDHPVQEVLDLGHALVAITQRAINTVVSF